VSDVSGTEAEWTLCGLCPCAGKERDRLEPVTQRCQDDRCRSLKWALKAEGRLAGNQDTMGGRFVKSH